MPRGVRVDWTRELLEEVQSVSGEEDALALAERLGVAHKTLYSVKGRIASEGIDEILRKQSHRNEQYTLGGAGGSVRPVDTLDEQLGRTHNITVAKAGRGGSVAQYGVTIPSRIGEAWVATWGRQIRFQPTEDGLLIVPVKPLPAAERPDWLSENRDAPA